MRIGRPNFTQAMPPYLLFADIRAAGTDGGTTVNGVWTTRPLNTEAIDTHNLGSLSSNQITLAAGTYRFRGRGALSVCDRAMHRLYDVSNGAAIATQICDSGFSFNGGAGMVWPEAIGRFTLSSSTVLELQYQVETANVNYGLGVASSWADECYATLEFWREP